MAGKKRLITPEQIEAAKEHRRAWYRARHARCKEKRNAARREAHAKNPERLRMVDQIRYLENPIRKKHVNIKSKYGMDAFLAHESIDHCESCGDYIAGKQKHIDHDHSLPRKLGFRGILCSACNIALGYLKNDPLRALSLSNYATRKRNL